MTLSKGFRNLGHEGLRLFFVVSAFHLALWPLFWVVVQGFDLPFESDIPASIWHAHEMLVGGFGAALIGFITTAVPEWTDTPTLRNRPLYVLLGLWAVARCVGLLAWDNMIGLAAVADLAWMLTLIVYLTALSRQRRTDRLLGFLFWLGSLAFCEAGARFYMLVDNLERLQTFTQALGFVFLGLLAIALGRITVPVTNLVLDPSEKTSPFRPHPGRLNLAAGLVWVAMVCELLGTSESVRGFLWIAAGAGYMDRLAESFVGRAFFRAEIVVLWAASLLTGIGLLLLGASYLGTNIASISGLHVATMGGAGFGIIAVFTTAGLLHTDHTFPFPAVIWLVMICLLISVGLRVGPDLGLFSHPFHAPYALASIIWSTTFAIWLGRFLPILTGNPNDAQ
ncbi:NnrS family protein [Shimia sagamensis]|uniref:Uncharacterized protein involved in response to NO n=1 Tax=Shimia sagamensis TaxID=1566352 RepID=A0ABY1PDG4_9RHOB|nr:NnrS family protein [Shimia sagamensis]SMP31071.1 uncharacterized protein involved in response to NO [Shimia sagamensis]